MRYARKILGGCGVAAAGVVLLLSAGGVTGGDQVPVLRSDESPSSRCDRRDLRPELRLRPAQIDSIGRTFSAHNLEMVELADSLLRAGRFGPPDDSGSQERARLFLQLRAWSAMKYLADIAENPRGVAWLEGKGMMRAFREEYRNSAVYPLRFIQRAWVGDGGFCLIYNVPEGYDETQEVGDMRVRIHREVAKLPGGRKRPVLSREYVESEESKVEILFEDQFSGRISSERVIDRGDTLEVITLSDLDGIYVRKAGIHRLTALAVWANAVEGLEEPEHPRIGACAYFPSIKFSLPWFLPDLGLADLRGFSFPPPILASELFSDPAWRFPAWLEARSSGQFKDWNSVGPRPEIIELRFPDL